MALDHNEMNRRSWLKTVAGIVGLTTLGVTGASADGDYEEIIVPEGETYSINLGDNDSLKNVLLDITAPGADYEIYAFGDGWEIVNFGIRGSVDTNDSEFQIRTDGGYGLLKNVYLGDGNDGDVWEGELRDVGLFVHAYHSGTIRIENLNVQNWSDNGLYGSAPGNPSSSSMPGGGGTVEVVDSYSAHNVGGGAFRLGTDGSYCKNCVAYNSDRGFWGYYNHTELIDCDFLDNGEDMVISGSRGAEVTVENTKWETQNGSAVVNGSSAGTPENRMPEGVPQTAEEAASGGQTQSDDGSDGGDGDGSDTEDGSSTDGDGESDEVAIITKDIDFGMEYVMEVTGEASRADLGETPSGNAIHSGKSQEWSEETEDGWRFGGTLGEGWGHGFLVGGEITRFEAVDLETGDPTPEEYYWVERNGECVIACEDDSEPEETQTDEVAIITKPEANGFDYEMEVTGSASREDLGETPSGNDIHSGRAAEWEEQTADGWIFGGTLGDGFGHGFLVEGEIVRFEVSDWETGDDPVDEYWVERNGECIIACPDEGGEENTEECPDMERPHTLVIDGTATDTVTKYTFTVSGSIAKEPELTSVDNGGLPWDSMEDNVSGDTATGIVGKAQDGYRFSGEITDQEVRGDASVSVTRNDCS